MLFNQKTGAPVVFSFIGYDNLFGSHYDEYVFEYDEVDTNVDPSVFDIYQSECSYTQCITERLPH